MKTAQQIFSESYLYIQQHGRSESYLCRYRSPELKVPDASS